MSSVALGSVGGVARLVAGCCGRGTRRSAVTPTAPRSSGVRVLPRADDSAMPHLRTVLRGFGRAGAGRRRSGAGRWCSSACLFTLAQSSRSGSSPARWSGCVLAVLMQRFRVVERGLLPYVVLSQTVPLVALAPVIAGWGGRLSSARTRGSPGCRWRPSPRTWRSSRSRSGCCAGCSRRAPIAVELMRSYAAGWWRTLVKLRLPAAAAVPVPGAAAGRRGRGGRRRGRGDLHRHPRRHRPAGHRVLPGGHL